MLYFDGFRSKWSNCARYREPESVGIVGQENNRQGSQTMMRSLPRKLELGSLLVKYLNGNISLVIHMQYVLNSEAITTLTNNEEISI